MMMEEKLVINELELGKELANRLMNNLKHTSSVDSNKTLISDILRIYQNAIFMLSFNQDKNILKRSLEIDGKDSKNVFKKRKVSEKNTEKVKVFVATEQENGSIDDGHCWRKYGQKEIHGSKNPRAYYRCTHRFTQDCLAVKQVQKSDTDPSLFEVKYLGNHTCNNITSPKTTTNFSVSLTNTNIFEGNRVHVTEQSEDMKPTKSEEVMISLEDLENKKNIFRTFSFSNHEIENGVWKSNLFLGNFVEDLSPATSGSAITSEVLSAPAAVENSETADSYFSSLDNIIDFGQDWLWS
ncbi:putative WRKY transcription factor 46 [Arabidopsis thaliana]|uniref:Probable WRKY transcription factor 46 n=4 Tax=Arabidopsis TaxID=3701 RepID=WRK46_ARATH|nr:WRKY DNA-binding protein 46 [Arabidopsis thaliana]Q9SKD9.1 RecName: Full=Probable WRKY transcription factor 46; AltName: Full=WRKY DNA-binding protein 46 [Arabidopsis thaliana]KAG7639918.1 WRKY domain [Arabidopsis thaliana x Arabidopsis arenosa]KAG7644506.1 WRKY domain [Arabidopsis suecica]AAD23042.1 putative WRKY-type DNA binding protein [Arabidopsis thaliana]AAK96020.1 WRKY transcription factor 46 [Arabidopsis thaliana]AAL87292.1 putative WRKY-type DNA binding protein [Arabidopsis thalia|eukprot:NP_182163.1 WRKY DNA-binding protein 46 [Arabidopsis thaliana]